MTLVILTLVFGLSACSGDRGPKITLYDNNGKISAQTTSKTNNTSANRQNSTPPPAQISASGYHIVKKGETLYAISKAYQVPLRSIIEENSLKAPYSLKVRQKLFIPIRPVYKVKSGDTVYGIAKKQQVSMNEMVRVNNLKAPYNIFVGQELLMPGQVVASKPKVTSTNLPIQSNNTQKNKTKSSNQIAINPAPKAVKYGSTRQTNKGFPRPYPKPREPSKKLAAVAKPAARASSKFLWPVKGKLISNYGAKGKGLYNDGLNIAAPNGAPIKSAENGVVAYAGTELKGYGNLILIKHADGYLTAYAHNSANLVKRGEKIKRGQTIAKVGTSGNVDRPQLHFQIRKGKRTVNPSKYLGKG